MELVDNARLWFKKYSTWVFSFIAATQLIAPYLPFMKGLLSDGTFNALTAAVAVAGILATQLKQANVSPAAVEEAKQQEKDAQE